MRIGLVCPYSLDVPGGVQNHVRDLAEVLLERGYDVSVLAPGEESAGLPAYVQTVGKAVPVPYNGSVARLAFGPRVANRVRRWLADSDFDLLHVHEPAVPSVSLLAVWAADCPVVATFHTANTRSRSMSSAAALLRPALEKISARIAVSESARSTLVQHLGGEPVVIPNGLNCAVFAAAAPVKGWQEPGPTLAFLGRTDEPRKGLSVLLSALPVLLEQHRDLRLLVAGRGSREVFDSLDPLSRQHVESLGAVSDLDRSRLLASVSVYVAPHTGGESFGIVLAEALAAGSAVAASDLPPFRAVLGDGRYGALFTAGDPVDCARVLGRLLASPDERAALRATARQAAWRYDWSHVAPAITSVYDTVALARSQRV
ncbi:MAG: phosphatidyl-myo-inositol alpha-mannosyltransferase [Pseudonocardiales bacterium]|nr:phosphatidyl-myo-inositol alpha-mannosyltransferase [Pseudonocardiales bacterium]